MKNWINLDCRFPTRLKIVGIDLLSVPAVIRDGLAAVETPEAMDEMELLYRGLVVEKHPELTGCDVEGVFADYSRRRIVLHVHHPDFAANEPGEMIPEYVGPTTERFTSRTRFP